MAALEARSRRRVVLISYYYPPGPEVGGLRAQKVARAFLSAGYEVVVITARVGGDRGSERPDDGGIRIVTVSIALSPRAWYANVKRLFTPRRPNSSTSKTKTALGSYVLPAHVPLWKRAIVSLLWLPDDHQGFIGPAVRAARPMLCPGDIVYTTALPFSVHLVGLRLKRPGIRWVAEFRDPWTDNAWKPWQVRTALTDAVERWLERRVLRRTDLIVAVSEGLIRLFRRKVGAENPKLLLVRNGIEQLVASPAPPRIGAFRIVHVGTFYFRRDPRPFLAGLALFRAQHRLDAETLQVQLVGKCRWFREVSIEQEVERLGLKDVVEFYDWMPHDECQRLILNADALLLLAMHQPDQVPNKLYEYLGTRVPVLALADEEGESARMLHEAGGHQVVTNEDPHAVAAALSALLCSRGVQAGGAILEEWTTGRQMAILTRAVEAMA